MRKPILFVLLALNVGSVFANEEVVVRRMVFSKSEGFVKCVSVCEDKADKECAAVCRPEIIESTIK